MSPGRPPRMVVSGTRESEQPSQRMVGDWPLLLISRRSGCISLREAAHLRFASRCLSKSFCSVVWGGGTGVSMILVLRFFDQGKVGAGKEELDFGIDKV